MNKLLRGMAFSLLAIAQAQAQAPYASISELFWGPKTVLAGYSNWYMFLPRLAIPITCDPSSYLCTATGYTFQGSETANFQSTGTPPAGIYTLWDTTDPIYGICEVQGSSFRLHQNNCAGPLQTFTDAGTGAQNLLLSTVNIFYTSITGLPTGTTWTWTQKVPAGMGGPTPTQSSVPYDQGEGDVLELRIPANTAPGTYQVSITVAVDAFGSSPSTLTWPITVLPPPGPPAGSPPTVFPPIPGLAGWQTQMISSNLGAAQWCANPAAPTEVFDFGQESQVWYYDGARVYFQIADYTGNLVWRNCAHNIASQYADYIILNNGGLPGWRVFPVGLATAAGLYPTETKFKQALDLLLTGSPYVALGGYPADSIIRETAYAVDTYVTAEQTLHEPRNPHLQRSAEFLMGMLLSYSDGTGRYSQYQTFYDGLALEALIGYSSLTADPRVPYVVKRMLDDIWSRYDQVNHTTIYDPDPPGPHCGTAPTWFDAGGGNCANYSQQLLQNLVSPAFAWYWKLTGDDTYRVRGDDMFQHGLDGNGIFSGKQFSQGYRWTFDYTTLRGAPRPVRGR